jgi:hypothetical protein
MKDALLQQTALGLKPGEIHKFDVEITCRFVGLLNNSVLVLYILYTACYDARTVSEFGFCLVIYGFVNNAIIKLAFYRIIW